MSQTNTTNTNMDFGIRLTNARKEAGKTQTEAAASLGITLRQWQRYEAGFIPGRKKIQEIEELLKCDLSDVLGEKRKAPEIGALDYAVSKILKMDATLEVLTEATAELLARSLNTPVTGLLHDLKKSIEERVQAKRDELK